MNLNEALKQLEKTILLAALAAAKQNVSLAARALGLNRTTIAAKLRRHKISPPPAIPDRPAEPKWRRKKHNEWTAVKERFILEALERNEWNRARTAAEVGVSRRYIALVVQDFKDRGLEIPDTKNFRGRPKKNSYLKDTAIPYQEQRALQLPKSPRKAKEEK